MPGWWAALVRSLSRERMSAGQAIVNLAESWLAQGVAEVGGQNAGPDVSWLIHDGGGSAKSRPPWCAYFVSSVCRQAERAGFSVDYTSTGRAVSHWLKSDPSRRYMPSAIWGMDPRGLVFIRTRLSNPVGHVDRVLGGGSAQGHVGVVVSVDPVARTVDCVAGNSSGWGHSARGGSGAVMRERMTEGDRAWQRLVGFVRVGSP